MRKHVIDQHRRIRAKYDSLVRESERLRIRAILKRRGLVEKDVEEESRCWLDDELDAIMGRR